MSVLLKFISYQLHSYKSYESCSLPTFVIHLKPLVILIFLQKVKQVIRGVKGRVSLGQ